MAKPNRKRKAKSRAQALKQNSSTPQVVVVPENTLVFDNTISVVPEGTIIDYSVPPASEHEFEDIYNYILENANVTSQVAAKIALLARANPSIYQSVLERRLDQAEFLQIMQHAQSDTRVEAETGRHFELSAVAASGGRILDDESPEDIVESLRLMDQAGVAQEAYKIRYGFPETRGQTYTDFDPVTQSFTMHTDREKSSENDEILQAKVMINYLKAAGHDKIYFKGYASPRFVSALLRNQPDLLVDKDSLLHSLSYDADTLSDDDADLLNRIKAHFTEQDEPNADAELDNQIVQTPVNPNPVSDQMSGQAPSQPTPTHNMDGGMSGQGGGAVASPVGVQTDTGVTQENLTAIYAYIKSHKPLPPHLMAQMALLARMNPGLYQKLIQQNADMGLIEKLQHIANVHHQIQSKDGENFLTIVQTPVGRQILNDDNAFDVLKSLDYNGHRSLYKVQYAFPKSANTIHTEYDPVAKSYKMHVNGDADPQDRVAHAKLILEQLKASGYKVASFNGECSPEFIDAMLAAYAQTDGIAIDVQSLENALGANQNAVNGYKQKLADVEKYKVKNANLKKSVDNEEKPTDKKKTPKEKVTTRPWYKKKRTYLATAALVAGAVVLHDKLKDEPVKTNDITDDYNAFRDYDAQGDAEASFENVQWQDKIDGEQAFLDGYRKGMGERMNYHVADKKDAAEARYSHMRQENLDALSTEDLALHQQSLRKTGNPFGPEMVDMNRVKKAQKENTPQKPPQNTQKMHVTPGASSLNQSASQPVSTVEEEPTKLDIFAESRKDVLTPIGAEHAQKVHNQSVVKLKKRVKKINAENAAEQKEIDERQRILDAKTAYQENMIKNEKQKIMKDIELDMNKQKAHIQALKHSVDEAEKTLKNVRKGKLDVLDQNKDDISVKNTDDLYPSSAAKQKRAKKDRGQEQSSPEQQKFKNKTTLFGGHP
jgi:hypothetical protein